MRSYFQLFFSLLVPLSGLFVIVAVLYLKIDHELTKAIRLGVLVGFLLAVSLSLVLPIFLLIMRRSKHTQQKRKKRKHKAKIASMQQSLTDSLPLAKKVVDSLDPIELIDTSIVQTIMLLMDKELALDVAYYAISEEKIGTLTENKNEESHITVKNGEDIIELTITSLTRHTSQVKVLSKSKSASTKKILTYMKQKEYSFLQY